MDRTLMLLEAVRWYRMTMLVMSVVCGLIAIYYVYKFKSYSKTRFLKLRKPNLIVLYCCSSIFVMIFLCPAEIYLTAHDIGNGIFWMWLSTFGNQFIISCMLILIAARCWLLYYDHSYGVSLVDKNWKGAITEKQQDFWLKYRKTWGETGFIICFAFIIATTVLVALLSISIYALQYNDLLPVHLVSLVIVAVPCCVLMFLIIFSNKLKKLYLYDEFMVIQEMQYLSLSSIIMIIVYIIELSEVVELHMIAQTGQILFSFLSTYIQTQWVIKQLRQQIAAYINKKTVLKAPQGRKAPLTMSDILKNKDGFTMFMRHCQNELNVEGLLFIVEVAQYKAKLLTIIDGTQEMLSNKRKQSAQSEDTNNTESKHSHRYSFSQSVSNTAETNDTDHESTALPALKTVRGRAMNVTEQALEEFEGHILSHDWVPISDQLFQPRRRSVSDLVRISNDLQITIFSGDNEDLNEDEKNCEQNEILGLQQQDKKMYGYAQHLFLKYIDVDSDFTINVSYSASKELLLFFSKGRKRGFQYILNQNGINTTIINNKTDQLIRSLLIKNYLYGMFDTTLNEIWKLLSSDTYIRFRRTKQYQYLLKHHKILNKV